MTRRDLAALLTVVVVAVPGLAIAQDEPDGPSEETETTEATETPTDEQTTADDAESTDDSGSDEDGPATRELTEEQDLEDDEELEAPEEADEADEADGHGAAISALARCLPSGRQLHGTGWTKGAIVSQAASTGEVSLDDQSAATAVETPEDAEAVCAQVQELVDEADAPDRAKGRPDWAGQDAEEDADAEQPEDAEAPDEGVEGDAFDAEGDDEATGGRPDRGRGGPPSHANGRGRG